MFRTTVKVRAIYGDTDAMGIVYHTNYIRWFEIGRTELFRNIGILYTEVESAGYNLPVTQVYCHYHKPARFDDIVTVETGIEYVKRASLKFTYSIWNEGCKTILTEGYTVHACTDRNGQIVRMPAEMADKLRQF